MTCLMPSEWVLWAISMDMCAVRIAAPWMIGVVLP
jgi:hypothetical protein